MLSLEKKRTEALKKKVNKKSEFLNIKEVNQYGKWWKKYYIKEDNVVYSYRKGVGKIGRYKRTIHSNKWEKIAQFLFGDFPPKKFFPNIWRSIIYTILSFALMYLYGSNMDNLVLKHIYGWLLIIVTTVIVLRIIYSYYFLVEIINKFVKNYWSKAKWNYLYPRVVDWLNVTNIEKSKAYYVLDTLYKRNILKNTNLEYKKIQNTNRVNGYLVYESLVCDLSSLSKSKILTMQNYLKSQKKIVINSYQDVIKKLLESFPLLIVLISSFLTNNQQLSIKNSHIEGKVNSDLIGKFFNEILRVWNQGFIYQYCIVSGLIVTIFFILGQFLDNRRESRTEYILIKALNEVLEKMDKNL